MTGRQGGRPSSPRPRARWRPAVITGTYVSMAVFLFSVIASVGCRWHQAVTDPAIVVSVIVLVACVLVLNLTAGDDE